MFAGYSVHKLSWLQDKVVAFFNCHAFGEAFDGDVVCGMYGFFLGLEDAELVAECQVDAPGSYLILVEGRYLQLAVFDQFEDCVS